MMCDVCLMLTFLCVWLTVWCRLLILKSDTCRFKASVWNMWDKLCKINVLKWMIIAAYGARKLITIINLIFCISSHNELIEILKIFHYVESKFSSPLISAHTTFCLLKMFFCANLWYDIVIWVKIISLERLKGKLQTFQKFSLDLPEQRMQRKLDRRILCAMLSENDRNIVINEQGMVEEKAEKTFLQSQR